MITIQHEHHTRRGTTVRERTFKTEEALIKWADANPDSTILRYLHEGEWNVSACAVLAGKTVDAEPELTEDQELEAEYDRATRLHDAFDTLEEMRGEK